MTTITFVINKRNYLNGRNQFTVLRISDSRLDVVSHHKTVDQAMDAARGYASKAKFAGLDARIFARD